MTAAGTFVGLGERLDRRAQLSADRIALVDVATGARLSYRALNMRAHALAVLLSQRHGIRAGDRVAVLAANCPEYLDALFASALLGATLVPLNWRLTVSELGAILADCEPSLLLHYETFRALAVAAADERSGPPLLAMTSFPGEGSGPSAHVVPVATCDGEEIALMLYTPGTTGAPKGALLSHRMLTWNAINMQITWGLRESDVAPIVAPIFHAGGLNVLTTPLYHLGGTVVLLQDTSPAAVLRAIAAERCTLVFAVPTVFQLMLESPSSPPRTSRRCASVSPAGRRVRCRSSRASPCAPGNTAGQRRAGAPRGCWRMVMRHDRVRAAAGRSARGWGDGVTYAHM